MWIYLLLLCKLAGGHNVAVIGGGVGGASQAFFLNQLFQDGANVKVCNILLKFGYIYFNIVVNNMILI